jgi:hypothetical protein
VRLPAKKGSKKKRETLVAQHLVPRFYSKHDSMRARGASRECSIKVQLEPWIEVQLVSGDSHDMHFVVPLCMHFAKTVFVQVHAEC